LNTDQRRDETTSDVAAAGDPEATMEVLRSHVPLTLLMDLGSAEGPDSARISAIEGGDADWLTQANSATRATATQAAVPVAAGDAQD
jgi:hypothetical protein